MVLGEWQQTEKEKACVPNLFFCLCNFPTQCGSGNWAGTKLHCKIHYSVFFFFFFYHLLQKDTFKKVCVRLCLHTLCYPVISAEPWVEVIMANQSCVTQLLFLFKRPSMMHGGLMIFSQSPECTFVLAKPSLIKESFIKLRLSDFLDCDDERLLGLWHWMERNRWYTQRIFYFCCEFVNVFPGTRNPSLASLLCCGWIYLNSSFREKSTPKHLKNNSKWYFFLECNYRKC